MYVPVDACSELSVECRSYKGYFFARTMWLKDIAFLDVSTWFKCICSSFFVRRTSLIDNLIPEVLVR